MTVEAALREAERYETRIRELYAEAARSTTEAEAQAFYKLMEKDEDSHVRYLADKLEEWKATGIVTFAGLASALPDPGIVEKAAEQAGASLKGRSLGGETEALARALKAEEETTAFYKKLVSQVEGVAATLFSRFLEIEEGHTRIVRAELDLRSRTGHWFDVREFDLED